MSLKISIIIPTKNSERFIEMCLKSIVNNGYKNYEIILVDQSSTDSTLTIAKKYKTKVINTQSDGGYTPPSMSRNIGSSQATGDLIYHLDSDMELPPGLLKEINSVFNNKNVVACVIPETDNPSNIWAKAKSFERSLYLNTKMEGARVSRREIFNKIKYDPSITSGEDWFIHSQFEKAGKISRTSLSVIHQIGSISPYKEFKKKFSYGAHSKNYLDMDHKHINSLKSELFTIYVNAIIKNLFTKPHIVVAFIFLRLIDYVSLNLGVLYGRWHFAGDNRQNVVSSKELSIYGRTLHSASILNHKRKRVLVVGDSYGWYAKKALEDGADYVLSIDIANPSDDVGKTKKRFSNFDHKQVSVFDLNTEEKNKFDAAVFLEVIEHLPIGSEILALKKINNSIKKGGELLISTPSTEVMSFLCDPALILGHRHYSDSKLKDILIQSGFTIKKIYKGGWIFSAIDILLLYVFKWVFKKPYNSPFKQRMSQEYPHKHGITLFALCVKS